MKSGSICLSASILVLKQVDCQEKVFTALPPLNLIRNKCLRDASLHFCKVKEELSCL